MHTLSDKIRELVSTNNISGLEDLQLEIKEVVDFSKRSVARTLSETVTHHKNVEQAEANAKLVKNAINELVKNK